MLGFLSSNERAQRVSQKSGFERQELGDEMVWSRQRAVDVWSELRVRGLMARPEIRWSPFLPRILSRISSAVHFRVPKVLKLSRVPATQLLVPSPVLPIPQHPRPSARQDNQHQSTLHGAISSRIRLRRRLTILEDGRESSLKVRGFVGAEFKQLSGVEQLQVSNQQPNFIRRVLNSKGFRQDSC
jgi:hypothetical protein